jgi:HSP20 family protein
MPMLERRAPLPDLDLVERRMRRLFDGLGFGPLLTPAADVYEADDELMVELEVPGFAEKELKVSVSDHTLTIAGHREDETSKKNKTLRMHERLESRFERRFHLPSEADVEHVKAEYGNGVLTLHVPKIQTAIPTTVPIETR